MRAVSPSLTNPRSTPGTRLDCWASNSQRIHFLHVRSAEPNAMPLLMTHGWPVRIAGRRRGKVNSTAEATLRPWRCPIC